MVAVGAGGTRRAELMEDAGPMRECGDTTVEEPTDVLGHNVGVDADGMVDTGRDTVTYGDSGVGPYPLG